MIELKYTYRAMNTMDACKNEVDPFLWVCKLIYKERGKEGLEGGGD